jgi:hypothetical protein
VRGWLLGACILGALAGCAPGDDRRKTPAPRAPASSPQPAPIAKPAPLPGAPASVPLPPPVPVPGEVPSVTEFENYLVKAGLDGVVPTSQLMRTASDWERCGGPQLELPPREHWDEVRKVLALVRELKRRGILREFEAVSNYRNPRLNACAGGAPRSAHVRSFAMDIVAAAGQVDEARLCEFWREQGRAFEMGLSKYPSGRIHLDTSGYRTWGANHRAGSSFCMR